MAFDTYVYMVTPAPSLSHAALVILHRVDPLGFSEKSAHETDSSYSVKIPARFRTINRVAAKPPWQRPRQPRLQLKPPLKKTPMHGRVPSITRARPTSSTNHNSIRGTAFC